MGLGFLRSGRGILSRLVGSESVEGIISASEFEAAFVKECARSDRTARPLSLVALKPVEGESGGPRRLAAILRQRARTTDIAGRLTSNQVGVLLTETDAAGARIFADDLLRLLAVAGLKYDVDVYTYPAERARLIESGRRIEAEKQPAGGVDVCGRGNGNGNGRGHGTGNGHGTVAGAASGSSKASGTNRVRPQPRKKAKRRGRTRPRGALSAIRQESAEHSVGDLSRLLVQRMSIWKRGMDIIGSAILLILLSPLLLAVAVTIKATSPGPVIFRQKRAGLGGVPFDFYKFRSMYMGAEQDKENLAGQNEVDGPIFKIRNDPRRTPFGRFIRKWSIDEFPQLWNVLKGDMSLVGPRPPTLDEVPNYEQWQRHRLDVTGGITCIWQVSGRSQVAFKDWMRMDARYIRIRSLGLDVSLLLRTVRAVISGTGAY